VEGASGAAGIALSTRARWQADPGVPAVPRGERSGAKAHEYVYVAYGQ